MQRKKPEADLSRYYTVFLQLGLILTLAIFIVAVKIDITSMGPEEYVPPSTNRKLLRWKKLFRQDK